MARTVQGTLYMPNNAPLANATFFLTSKRTEMVGVIKGIDSAFTTNGSGYYTQSVHDGFYQVSVSHPHAGNPARRFNLGNILVEPGGPVSINELLQFSDDAENPLVGEIQEMYEQIIAARDTAQSAAGVATTKRDEASGFANTASTAAATATTKRNEASGFATAANTAATTAATKRDEASGFASTASTAATTATTKRDEAGGFASTASTAATTATTKRDEAGGFASTASTAATTATTKRDEASGFASTASAAAITATTRRDEASGFASTASTAATTATTKRDEAGGFAAAASDAANAAASKEDQAANAALAAMSAADTSTAKAGEAAAARDEAAALKDDAESAAGVAELWKNIAMQFAQNGEDVPVVDGDGNPIGYSAKHYAEKAEEIVGGFGLDSSLFGLVAKQGGAFTQANSLREALQVLVDAGIGSVNTFPETKDAIASFDDLWALPQGKTFMVTGASVTASYFNTVTAGLTNQYSIGNSAARDLMVKQGSMEWVTGGITYRRVMLSHRGMSAQGSLGGMKRNLIVRKNMSDSTILCNAELAAVSTDIPVELGCDVYFNQPWITGKDASIASYYVRFAKLNIGSRFACVTGNIVLTADLAAGGIITMFAPTDYTLASENILSFIARYGNVGGEQCAAFPLSAGISSSSIRAEVVFNLHSGSPTTVAMILKNTGLSALPAGSYIFNAGYVTA